jgi:predicted trehalose synthase
MLSPNGKVPVDQGGVDVNSVGLLTDEVENAMAISEDEPSLREALNGDERATWIDAIEAELAQMEKVNAWIPVIPPSDANIIPSRYVFCHKRNETGSIV